MHFSAALGGARIQSLALTNPSTWRVVAMPPLIGFVSALTSIALGLMITYPGASITSANHPRLSLQRRWMAKPPAAARVASMVSSYL